MRGVRALGGLICPTLAVLWALSTPACMANGVPGNGAMRAQGAPDDGGGALLDDGRAGCPVGACAPLECGPGMRALPLPGECCPTLCEPTDCSTVDCPPAACPSGSHAELPANRCCATCVKNAKARTGETCESGQAAYADYLSQTANGLGSSLCEADDECRIVVIDNPCDHGCGAAVSSRVAGELKARLSAYAAVHCAACEQTSPGCPPVERFPFCTGGSCSAH